MDVVIQTSNVSLAHRIMLYYEAKHPAVFRMEGVGETVSDWVSQMALKVFCTSGMLSYKAG